MVCDRDTLIRLMTRWEAAWNRHDLDEVMALFHDDVFFQHWHGAIVRGKKALGKAWSPWFSNHGGFRFTTEDLIVDPAAQKVLYQWLLEMPSLEEGYQGRAEKRRGVDVIHFKDGKIIAKHTYSKTTVEIDGARIRLSP